MIPPPPRSTLFPYTTLFRSSHPPWPWEKHRVDSPASKVPAESWRVRSEEHTSELQSLRHLVCRLLLEKKKNQRTRASVTGGNQSHASESDSTRSGSGVRCPY